MNGLMDLTREAQKLSVSFTVEGHTQKAVYVLEEKIPQHIWNLLES